MSHYTNLKKALEQAIDYQRGIRAPGLRVTKVEIKRTVRRRWDDIPIEKIVFCVVLVLGTVAYCVYKYFTVR